MNKIKSFFRYFMKHPIQMKLLFVLTFIIYGSIISAISYSISDYYQTEAIQTKFIETQKQSFKTKSNNLKTKIQKFVDELEALKGSKTFKNYINQNNENEYILDLFSVMINNNKELSQLRFIDLNGNEKIRFQRHNLGTTPFKIKEKDLQNKNSRYYFKNIKNTPKDVIWYSKLDLNVEHGKVQMPIVPTLRIGTSIYSNNTFKGIVIMNIFFKDIIEKLVDSPFCYISILDKDGDFIYHKHPDENGVMKDYSWSKCLKKDMTLDKHKQKFKEINNYPKFNEYILEESLSEIIPNENGLIVHYEPIMDKLNQVHKSGKNYIVTVTIILLFLSIPLSFIISILPNMLNDELYETKKLLEQEMITIDEHVYLTITDINGVILDVSQAYVELTGFSKEELIGKKHNILRHPDSTLAMYKDLWETILLKKVWKGELSNIKKNGEVFDAVVFIKPNLDLEGKIDTFSAYVQDITYQRKVEKISITDALTNLYNRREFNTVFERFTGQSKRYKHPFSMIILDIDYFKQYNDNYGHLRGDIALQKVAYEIHKATNRSTDLAFRLGGEEFGVLFSANNLEDAKIFSERLKNSIENIKIKHEKSKVNKYLTVSIGLLHIKNLDDMTENEIYSACDNALYEAKKSGRNQIRVAKIG